MSLDDVIKPMNRVDRATIIANASKNPILGARARKAAETLAREYLSVVPYQIKDAEGNFTTVKPEQFDAMTAEQRENITREVMNVMPQQSLEQAMINYAKIADTVDSKAISAENMASLMADREVSAGVKTIFAKKDKDGKNKLTRLVDEYGQLQFYQEFSKNLADNKPIDPEQAEQMSKVVAQGIIKANFDKYRALGYTDSVAVAAGKLAVAVNESVGDRNQMLKLGIGVLIKDSKKTLEGISKGYQEVVAGGVREYLAGEMKSSDVFGENQLPKTRKVVELIYRAKEGNKYGVGTREFNEVYKN
ncbi:MAG: hypothetical protein Q7R87_04155 [Nanoarchaeota archaeon]|nr:hypothetical protein [Nanoarchaeota archaeon]